jgi:FtsP/CotA-like multicopper oxidase with cupredoxin domain
LGAGASVTLLALGSLPAEAAEPIKITAAPTTVTLDPARGETAVLAYGGQVPGPLLRVRQGERLSFEVTNGLEEATTVHCHGVRLPNAMDGVPFLTQPPIEPGARFLYDFETVDAGTFWYHPHLRTTEQLARGLYGVIVVEEKEPPQVDRELILVLDDWRLRDDGSINDDFNHPHDLSHEGRMGNFMTISGKVPGDVPVRAGERLRLRLLNAANARVFAVNFGGLGARVIALDGQPVSPHTLTDDRLILGSAMRADVILDMTGKPGERHVVKDDYYDSDVATLFTFAYSEEAPLRDAPSEAPIELAPNPIPEPKLEEAEALEVVIEGGARGFMEEASFQGETYKARKLWREHRKAWALNGVAWDSPLMDPVFTLTLGKSYRWTIRNDTGWDHPMHLHGHSFRLLSRNGKPVPNQPWLDTVLMHLDETVEIAFVADNPGGWLFHCHILEHHEAGMGAVVKVVEGV